MGGVIASSAIEKAQLGGIWIVALTLLGWLIKQIGPWSKQREDAESEFRNQLIEANEKLTARVEKLEGSIKQQQSIHDAERALDRHRINNLTQCLDALLLLLQAAPDRAAEHVRKINEMRERQLTAEAEEKGIIQAAKIVANEPLMNTEGGAA